jgi:hypothetical protein
MDSKLVDMPDKEYPTPKVVRVTFFVNAAEGLVYLLGADGEGHKYLKDNVDMKRGCIFLCKLPPGCMIKEKADWRFIDTSFYPIKWQIQVYDKIAKSLLIGLMRHDILTAIKNREITLQIEVPNPKDGFFSSRYRKFDINKNDVLIMNANELDTLYRSIQPHNSDGRNGTILLMYFSMILYGYDSSKNVIKLEGIREPWRNSQR